jgi:digalactosyldiacylglycerol synthase
LDLELPKSLHEYRRTPIPAKFPGRVDHATLKQYKVFVNPSLSEVLCTTTAEALAMGKFVIIPVHPSNNFFMQFPNTLAYQNKLEFAANLSWALSHEPEPLTTEQQQLFTWEAATYRLIEASAITRREAKERQKLGTSRLDERIAWFHNEMGIGNKGDILRKVLGAGPAAEQVKYSKRQSPDGVDESTGGLSMKFVGSSLADAMRKTFSNGILAPEGTL